MIFQAQMTFIQGLQLTVIAMTIVFTLLFVISLILELFKYIPQKKREEVASKLVSGVNWNELESDEEMMVASLVASMEAAKNRKKTNYKIIRITKL